jgi:hypothetical protein
MRLIDANAFLERVLPECKYPELLKKAVDEQPTIEPEVRHGRWENIPGMNNTVFCSECGAAADKYLAKRYKGCPFCLCVMSATGTNVGGKGGNG